MGSIQKMASYRPSPMAVVSHKVGPAARSPAGWLATPGTSVQHATQASGSTSLVPRLNAGQIVGIL